MCQNPSHRISSHCSIQSHSSQTPPGMATQKDPPLLFSTPDIITEYQRGLTVLGYPFFSPNLLLRGIDPPQFQLVGPDGQTAEKGEIKPGGGQWPLDLHSHTRDFKWFVSMNHANRYETDDQGWTYSWRFHSSHWKASRGFVRKRFWVRLREKSPDLTPAEPESAGEDEIEAASSNENESEDREHSDSGNVPCRSLHSSESSIPFQELLEQLMKPSLDRQKGDLVMSYLKNLPEPERKQFLKPDSMEMKQTLETFQFDKGRELFLEKLHSQ
ncbi:LAFA_0A05952g1_1 [Lachancea sp. 'fantastica']|nr:LAFA_0A05952g1_1 [Lachancea sp. 'fantastica']